MNIEQKQQILATINRLASEQPRLNPLDVENMLMSVLDPLLGEDGYEVSQTTRSTDFGIDFFAVRPANGQHEACKVGIQFKYYRPDHAISVAQVRELLGAALLHEIDRAILLTSSRFNQQAHKTARRELPVNVELVDLDALRAWAACLFVDDKELVSEVQCILKVVSAKFARLIAQDRRVLAELEWRDVERTVAGIFDGLGFKVELTPSSKDGGKDVIVECSVHGSRQVYIIEIKHWRSNSRVGGGAVRDFLNVIVRE